MVNGSSTLKLVEPPSAPEPPARSERELEIGQAAADAATVLSVAMLEFAANGLMSPAIRTAGAEGIARLAQLQLDAPGENNFAGIARREGVRQLRKRLDAEPSVSRQHGDAALLSLIAGVLEIAGKVVALEKALATN
jgi:hypothetical protein